MSEAGTSKQSRSTDGASAAEAEVADLCAQLIQVDTSNFGDHSGPGERKAAELVASWLEEVGLETTVIESHPGRTSVVTRLEGLDQSRPGLLVHGHLDVVPAQAQDWRVHPFSGELNQDCIWGRGAVDMKDMDAMMLAVVRDLARTGRKPPRDVVVAFFADEEAGGTFGAEYVVAHHRELFDGVTEAVSEVGGFSITIGGRRAYLLQTAEKGIAWLRLVAHGRAGHGSQINTDNAVTNLARAVTTVGTHQWPIVITPTVKLFLDSVAELIGRPLPIDDPGALVGALGSAALWIGAILQTTANPTVLQAGYKHNVIPGEASALIDCRFLPGQSAEEVRSTIAGLVGDAIDVEIVKEAISLESPYTGDLIDAMTAALLAEDPEAAVLPYCLSGGTDNKLLAPIGITGYGFAPLRLPADLDFAGMFHGVDERVPVDALHFGTRVLDRFIMSS